MYGLLSDLHMHKWSRFSTLDAGGMSSRLLIILDEFQRAAEEILAAGGDTMVIAGDLFHVRGSIEPVVFNPTHARVKDVLASGLKIIAIPGNHDLTARETDVLGNAIQSFGSLDGFTVVTKPTIFEDLGVVLVPWVSQVDQLMQTLEEVASDAGSERENYDLIIHAGIDGVLPGMPDHGLTPQRLQKLGFKRVFAGHYHNHKVVAEGVISIGATTHQTFGDIGSRAGFLLVGEDGFTYRASRAPSFVEITDETDEDDIPLIVDGNYVRVRGLEMADHEINQVRDNLYDMGAKGVTLQVARKTQSVRSTTAASKGLTIDQSVDKFVTEKSWPYGDEVKKRCADILLTIRATVVETD